jgi:hypothetical protein
MAYRIQANRKNLSFTVHAVANTGTITVAGNSSVSNVAISDEVLTGAYITQVWAGSPSGNAAYWTVSRGANTVLVLDSSGYYDYAGCGNPITLDSTATLSANLVGATDGYIMLELTKEGTFVSEYLQN